LEQGEVEQKIMVQCVREGLPFPDRIQNAPTLLMGLELFFLGFMDLSSSRQIGMGMGPIPWQAINQYCTSIELNEEQTEAMHHHIRELDTCYLKHKNKKDV